MNNMSIPGPNRPDTIRSSNSADRRADSLPVNANGGVPVLNSVSQPNASLFDSSKAAAARGQQADFTGPGPEGINYANSKPAERRPEWHAFSSKVVKGVLTFERELLDAKEIRVLADWLKSSPPEVRTLVLEDIFFGSDSTGVAQLADALKVNTAVTSLVMVSCNLGDADAATLAGALTSNQALATLDFEYNCIGEIGAAALAEALKVNTYVTSLSLNCNNIRDAGAAALAEALGTNQSLTTLSLWVNGIRAAGAAALAEALKINQSLDKLFLDFNYIQNAGAAALAEALKTNRSLTTLGVARNGMQVAALVEVIKINTALTTLDIRDNHFADTDLATLEQTSKVNTTLTKLAIRYDYLTSADKRNPGIVAILKRNQELTRLIGQAGTALDLASGQQYPAELMSLIAGQFPHVTLVKREAALSTLQQLSASVETPQKAN